MDTTMNQKKINLKMLILYIVFALVAGGIGALLGGNMDNFEEVNKPWFSPPAIVFPIVWTILFVLMGISSYLVCANNTDKKFKKRACFIYLLQLTVNVLWSLFFFRLRWYFFSFIWVLLLLLFIIFMIVKFYKIKPLAGYLQIPYLIWTTFAAILTYSIYTLN